MPERIVCPRCKCTQWEKFIGIDGLPSIRVKDGLPLLHCKMCHNTFCEGDPIIEERQESKEERAEGKKMLMRRAKKQAKRE
jgi:hypothetical protein